MTRWMTLLGLALAACDGGEKGDDTGAVDDTGETGGAGAFAPAEGDWAASVLTPISDDCGIFDDIGDEEGGTVTLTLTSETSFSLIDEDDFAVECTLSGQAFDCGAEDSVEDYTGKGVDVVLTTSFGYGGTFASTTAGTVSFNVDVTCEGEDCDFVTKKAGLTLPCTSTAEASISLIE